MKTQNTFNSRSMGVNDGNSYYPYEIEKWCRHTLRNPLTSSEEMADAADIWGDYFVNPVAPLRSSNKYFIQRNIRDGSVYLYRDRNEDGMYRVIANGRYYDVTLSGKEKKLLEDVFGKLLIPSSFTKL